MASLREALRGFLKGWRNDLAWSWRQVLRGVEPDFEAVRADLELADDQFIFPGRRGRPIPGAPGGAHVFRALDGVRPSAVRAVILGQDPYPNYQFATGRAFEQGDLESWPQDPKRIADSLARIVQTIAAAGTGKATYAKNDAAWRRVFDDLQSGALRLAPPNQLFDVLDGQGTLWLNTGLTISRFQKGGAPEQLEGHIPLWRPIIRTILTHLATRGSGRVVFLLWGSPAQRVFREAGVQQAAEAAGTWHTRAAMATHAHPAAVVSGKPSFFRPPNPLVQANDSLVRMGGKPINWSGVAG
jgi:uracil-DNA glycosylase